MLNTERPTNLQYISKSDSQWLQHLTKLQQIKSYSITGQIGYISEQQRFSARFNWQYQDPQFYSVKFYSALSSNSLEIQVRPTGMTVLDHKGNQRKAQDSQSLLQAIIGVDLPLAQIALWFKGIPSDGSDYQVGVNHLLANFSYNLDNSTWTADYLTYHSNSMPENILLTNQSQSVKIRIDNWKL